jgi:hypothetical protein
MKFLTDTLLLSAIILLITSCVFAQEKTAQPNQSLVKKTVIFKMPDGFLPAEMNKPNKGLMMLNPKKPAGMFVAYTPDNQKSEDFILELRETLARFFVNDKDVKFDWKEASLPLHDGVANETGKLLMATAKDKEVQVVAYTRTIAEGQDVIYGYFAMKDLKSKKNSADLIDASGKGVKEFESFWKTIDVQK